MKTRTTALKRRNDRLAVVALLTAISLALLVVGSARTMGTFTGATNNPANSLATGTSLWFDATGTTTSICIGLNGSLTCAFGSRDRPVTVIATSTLNNKNAASNTFTLSVVNGTGPADISTIVTPTFLSTGTATESLGAGAADTLNVRLKTKGGTAVGTYTGWVRVTDSTTARSFDVPVSVTVV